MQAIVIGGANTDIVGISDAELIGHDSNPGRVRVSSGGVARNIAENLARLGVSTRLVTAFGGDHNAVALQEDCRCLGIAVDGSVHREDLPGSIYLAIAAPGGEMVLALNDMRPLDSISVQVIRECEEDLRSADVIVIDANVSQQVLVQIADSAGDTPIVFDPVSVAKAARVLPILHRVHTLKANEAEARELCGLPDQGSMDDVLDALLALGVVRVFVTCGAEGVHFSTEDTRGHQPAPVVEVVSDTGAGDAYTAGVAYSLLMDDSPQVASARCSALAALTLATDRTVSLSVSVDAVESSMKETRV